MIIYFENKNKQTYIHSYIVCDLNYTVFLVIFHRSQFLIAQNSDTIIYFDAVPKMMKHDVMVMPWCFDIYLSVWSPYSFTMGTYMVCKRTLKNTMVHTINSMVHGQSPQAAESHNHEN